MLKVLIILGMPSFLFMRLEEMQDSSSVKPVKHILFLTDNFPPEVNAPASRTFEHAREWVGCGFSVTVITCVPNFPHGKVFQGFANKLITVSYVEGIRVIRVWSYITANEGFLKRVLDYISFAVSALIVGIFVRADIIVATSPQFFTAIAGNLLAFLKFRPWIMEVRDLWPESIAAVGAMKRGKLYRFLEWVELRLYHSAKRIVVVTDSFKQNLVSRGVEPQKIFVHKNGVLINQFTHLPKDKSLLNEHPELKSKFVFAYVGTHGMAHGLSFVLDSLSELQNNYPQLHFLFIGEGAEKRNLLSQAKELNLTNVTFLPLVQKSEINRYLSLMDVALVNLRKSDTFKTVIPSKIFEAAAIGKPIFLGIEGETKEIILSYNCGICFEPENKMDFIKKSTQFLNEVEYREYQGGCKNLAIAFDRKQIALDMLETITKIP